MDKETLSNYGWIVICVLVLAVMIALATPFGNFISNAVKNTTQGLFDVNQKALNSTNLITIADQNFNENKIPNGGTYITGYKYIEYGEWDDSNITTLHAGEAFPSKPQIGDIYIYGDYEYCYNAYFDTVYAMDENYEKAIGENGEPVIESVDRHAFFEWQDFWSYYCDIPDGWSVRYTAWNTNKPTSPLTSINNAPIVCANNAWFWHTEIEYAPEIPDTVTHMFSTFSRCESLKTAPKMPSKLIEAPYCFYDNFALEELPEIKHCLQLYTADSMFENCTTITTLPQLPNGVLREVCNTFTGCTSLVDASYLIIPESVVDMYGLFANCSNLKYAPVIPSHVTSLWRTFRYCTSLEGTITINSSTVSQYSEAFQRVDMSKIVFAGNCDASTKQAIANTGKNGSQVTIIN